MNPLSFQRDGFVVVPNVFDGDEVARMRAAALEGARAARELGHILQPLAGETVPLGDLLGRDGIDVVFDDKLLSIARMLLGVRDLVYFGDSGLMVGGAGRGFHKDNTCRDDPTHSDWQTPYTLLRMGVYLEDHARHSGGLKVRRGSHLHADVSSGAIVDVPTRAGDVVVWSLRTTHSGHVLRVRGLPWLHLQPRFEVRLPAALSIPEPCERVALFLTYGIDDAHLGAYVKKHTDLEAYPENYIYKSWLYSSPDRRFDEIAESRGCKLLRPVPEWGASFGSRERAPLGYIPTKTGGLDHFPVRGVEALIQKVGAVVRSVRRHAS